MPQLQTYTVYSKSKCMCIYIYTHYITHGTIIYKTYNESHHLKESRNKINNVYNISSADIGDL